MEPENFNTWKVNDLKEYLLQYDILPKDIKGSGKNGNVIKSDLIRTVKKVNKKENFNNEPINITLTNDIYQEVLYNLPIDDIKSFCLSNKNTHNNICENKLFWENKFQKDNLPIIGKPTNLNEWFKEYQKVYNAVYESKAFIIYLKSGNRGIYIFNSPIKFTLLSELYGNAYNNTRIIQILHIENQYTINLYKYTIQGKLENKMTNINDDYVLKLLTYVLYYYPNAVIVDI